MTRSTADRLDDILGRIAAIDIAEGLLHSTVEGVSQTAFDAILYDLMVIGEAVKNLPDEMRARHGDIPWTDIARMRDLLAHVYFRVREATVRSTIDAPLAHLRAVCAGELAALRR